MSPGHSAAAGHGPAAHHPWLDGARTAGPILTRRRPGAYGPGARDSRRRCSGGRSSPGHAGPGRDPSDAL